MRLERLCYRSRASSNLGHLHLFHLLTQTYASNRDRDITGHLQYEDGVFTQYIEGPSDSVEAVWQRIQLDPRHHKIELLAHEPCHERRFADWTMSFKASPGFAKVPLLGFIPLEHDAARRLLERCLS